MILLCGIESEHPLAMVRSELDELGLPCLFFNQRRFDGVDITLEVDGTQVGGCLELDGRRFGLESFTGVYSRLMDEGFLPELEGEPLPSPRRDRCRALHETLQQWSEIAPCRVVNRPAAMASNHSKPYQAQMIRALGFGIPETLITNDAEAVREFRKRHGRVVYKSISGVRSIVQTLDDASAARLERIRWCPVQFQQYVEGVDVRVHTVGEEVIATEIRTNVTDYRYALRAADGEIDLAPRVLEGAVPARCVALAQSLGLAVAGIDLKLAPDGTVYCFEVNPSPAFSFFERNTGQPIARAIARYLAGEA